VFGKPDAANIHALLATPVRQSTGRSVAAVAPTHPISNSPADVGQQHLHGFGLVRFGRWHSLPWVRAWVMLGSISLTRMHLLLHVG